MTTPRWLQNRIANALKDVARIRRELRKARRLKDAMRLERELKQAQPPNTTPVVNLVMATTRGAPKEHHMATTRGAVQNGSGHNAGGTSSDNAGGRVVTTRGAGFCFSGGYHAGGTWDA